MIQNIGLPYSGGINYPMWYISVLIVGGLIVYLILWLLRKKVSENQICIISIVIGIGLYCVLFCNDIGTIEQWKNIGYVFYPPLIRGIADLLFGCSIAIFTERKKPNNNFIPVILLTVLVVGMLYRANDYVIAVLSYAVVFSSAKYPLSLLSRIGKSKVSGALIKHEYSMYLNHALVIYAFIYLKLFEKTGRLAGAVLIVLAVIAFAIIFDKVLDGIMRMRK